MTLITAQDARKKTLERQRDMTEFEHWIQAGIRDMDYRAKVLTAKNVDREHIAMYLEKYGYAVSVRETDNGLDWEVSW